MSSIRQGERPVEILLAEDNEADIHFFNRVLRDIAIPTTLHVVYDGRQALAFLRKHGEHAQAPTPDVVFLDLLLPLLSGHEVFVTMKREAALAQIPACLFVIDEHDPSLVTIARQGLQVGCWMTKPVQAKHLTAVLRAIGR